MRTFKKTYRNKDGKQEARNYTIEFKNHDDTVQRVPGTSDKASSEAAGKNIMLLVGYKYGGLSLASDIELSRWVRTMAPSLRTRLIKLGLLDKCKGESGKPLAEHLEAFRAKLKLGFKPKLKSGNSDKHVETVTHRVGRIVKECKFLFWDDINMDTVQECLSKFSLSDRTYNGYIGDFMQFIHWMMKSKRADIEPGGDLPKVECEKVEDKRAFTIDEVEELIQAAHAGPVRQKLKG